MGLILRRTVGLILLAATYLPLHRLLDPSATGLAGEATGRIAEAVWESGLWGTMFIVGSAWLLGAAVPGDPTAAIRTALASLRKIPAVSFALLSGAVACVIATAASLVVFDGLPSSVDEMVQLLHAQALVRGQVALTLPTDPASWVVQNSLVSARGWASVYPPLHTLALAGGLLIGAPWIVGPVATGVTAAFSYLSLDRLVPERPVLTRSAGLLISVTPFLFFLGGTHLSHATAGAFAALTLWTALRARDGGAGWSVVAGACAGAFVCTRPWTGLVMSAVLIGGAWLPSFAERKWAVPRLVGLSAGALPFAAGILAWDQWLFGNPLSLGYTAAYGPGHGLGFHTDPWGNTYGALQALAFSGSDLLQLGSHLLETPLPALAFIGLGLILLRGRRSGPELIVAWALSAVFANALYWHHGIHLGPRLLYETAPAWSALWLFAVVGLTAPDSPLGPVSRRTVGWATLLCVCAGIPLTLSRAAHYEPDEVRSAAQWLPRPPAGTKPALVFVHGSWPSRVTARLVSAGMRRDSIETAIRRNDLCEVDRFARWRSDPAASAPVSLTFDPLPGPAPELRTVVISPGNGVLLRPGSALDEACVREAHADRLGTVELEPLLWQAPPPSRRSGQRTDRRTGVPMLIVARDMGPAANAEVTAAFPDLSSWMVIAGAPGERPSLRAYAPSEEALWGGSARPSG